MKYFSIDIETTGSDPDKDQILEFAAIYRDTEKEHSDKYDYFHTYLRHDRIQGDIKALAMNSKIIEYISENYSSCLMPYALELSFFSWASSISGNENAYLKINVAGKNAALFDIPFLKKIFDKGYITFSHRVLDPAILYWQPEDERLPDLQLCLNRAGIEKTVTHTALDDARDVLNLLKLKGF